MTSAIHKLPIAEELRKYMEKDVVNIMLGQSDGDSGLLGRIYRLIGETSGAIELAYLRGFQAGQESMGKPPLEM